MIKKTIPRFRSEDEERDFWAKQDSTEFLDWSKAKRAIFPNLKPSTKTISLRLPESMIESLKLLANKRDVPYQSLMKVFLVERIEEEFPIVERRRKDRTSVARPILPVDAKRPASLGGTEKRLRFIPRRRP